MFRHKKKTTQDKKVTKSNTTVDDVKKPKEEVEETTKELKADINEGKMATNSTDTTKELLEKNLKWSQIIYEQNRKINRKLVWAAVAGWLRLLIILVPLALALLYMPPILKQVWGQYASLNSVLDTNSTSTVKSSNTLNSLMKILNLTPKQQEQVNNLTK